MYGPSVLDASPRRSVYLRVKRSELIPFMTMFDAPEPTQSIGERSSTTVPTQALAMMNSPFVRQQAEKLSRRIRPTADVPLTTAVDDQAYQHPLSRGHPPPVRNGNRCRVSSSNRKRRRPMAIRRRALEKAALVEFLSGAALPERVHLRRLIFPDAITKHILNTTACEASEDPPCSTCFPRLDLTLPNFPSSLFASRRDWVSGRWRWRRCCTERLPAFNPALIRLEKLQAAAFPRESEIGDLVVH